jgi:hypothetical protein
VGAVVADAVYIVDKIKRPVAQKKHSYSWN